MCDSCSTAISTESNPHDLKVLNHLVLSSVNGEVNRNVLMPNRMSVSSGGGGRSVPLERRYLTIKARLAQKIFWSNVPAFRSSSWPSHLCQHSRQHLAC